ncbi:MAG: ABC transporter permease [Clostridia bacterium]|nr:ABC transporter permease [Clostridia bacterium]
MASVSEKQNREPFVRILKRSDISRAKSWLIRVAAFFAAFLLCALLSVVLIGASPVDFFVSMLEGSFGNSIYIWKLLKNVAVLLCISLAVTPAFRMKFWNIGANGQVLVGALAAIACVIELGKVLPEWLLIIVMLAAAIVASMIWALLPALFKALWNTNETLFTLMMNYIATYLVAYYLLVWVKGGESSLRVREEGHLPQIRQIPGLEAIDESGYLLLILIVVMIAVFMYVYLNYSKHGYEISVVGESEKTAKYIGINVKKVIIRTMLLSGAVCGIAGFLFISALDHTITTDTVGGQGFTAIMVSWLASFNPFVMFLTSFLIIFLEQGSGNVATVFNVSSAFPNMVTGIILFFVIGSEFFIRYRLVFRNKTQGGSKK